MSVSCGKSSGLCGARVAPEAVGSHHRDDKQPKAARKQMANIVVRAVQNVKLLCK